VFILNRSAAQLSEGHFFISQNHPDKC